MGGTLSNPAAKLVPERLYTPPPRRESCFPTVAPIPAAASGTVVAVLFFVTMSAAAAAVTRPLMGVSFPVPPSLSVAAAAAVLVITFVVAHYPHSPLS